MLIFLVINGRKLVLMQIDTPLIIWSLLYFMLLLTFFESFFILYEKWYILEEDVPTYLAFNIASIGLLYLLVPTLATPITILATILGIRIATFIALSLFSFYRWKIWPSLRPRITIIISALIVSSLYYLIF